MYGISNANSVVVAVALAHKDSIVFQLSENRFSRASGGLDHRVVPTVENSGRGDEHINGPGQLIAQVETQFTSGLPLPVHTRVIRNQHEQVIVAVRSRLVARVRTKQHHLLDGQLLVRGRLQQLREHSGLGWLTVSHDGFGWQASLTAKYSGLDEVRARILQRPALAVSALTPLIRPVA